MKLRERALNCRMSLEDPKELSRQVAKLIKNKIEPLCFKHYVLKSTKCSANPHTLDRSPCRERLPNLRTQRSGGRKSKENAAPFELLTNRKQNRRKALVHLDKTFDLEQYEELQSKVENHIMLKKMLLMEDEYAQAEECNKKDKATLCKKLWTSPLEKYIVMFKVTERPSEKVRLVDEASCEKILHQIKTVKSVKHIECMEENVRGMWNNDIRQSAPVCKSKSKRKALDPKELPSTILKANDLKLRKDIMNDIKREYQTQGSTKIRININHHKMIQPI
jgi:hypothetical protein